MKTKAQFIITTFVVSITLLFTIIFFIKFTTRTTIKEQIKEPSRFEQAYEKIKYFDSLFYKARERGDIEKMIQFNDSTKFYAREMVKNLMED